MRFRSEKSTTLVETLVSATILMIAVGALLYAAIAAKYLINSSSNRQEVWNLITSRHEEISDWSDAFIANKLTGSTWSTNETATDLLQQGLLTDSPLRYSLVGRSTTITRLTNYFYKVDISVSFRQSHIGSPTTNLQEMNSIYMTPRY